MNKFLKGLALYRMLGIFLMLLGSRILSEIKGISWELLLPFTLVVVGIFIIEVNCQCNKNR